MKIVILLTMMLFGSCLGCAQSVCTIETLKVDGIAGTVIWNDKTELPISRVRLELLDPRTNDDNLPVAIFVTGEDGRFAFNDLTKGKYILSAKLFVDEVPYFEYRAVFNVRKSKARHVHSAIKLKLGLDCWKSEISVGK